MEIGISKKLDDSQLEIFDYKSLSQGLWTIVKKCIDADFPDGHFSFLDIGGGNGRFADLVLKNYPNSSGTVLDNAEVLLIKNTVHERKRLILESIENIHYIFPVQKFDIIFINWVLHHLVANSFYGTKLNIINNLANIKNLLSDRGRISIYDDIYDGFIFINFPSYLIYHLTSFKPIAPLVKKFGANTAGCGVLFLSNREWIKILKMVKLDIISFIAEFPKNIASYHKWLLFIHEARIGFFWVKKGS